jgi:hypothetical protein
MHRHTFCGGLALLLAMASPSFAQYAAAVGAYVVEEGEACRTSEWLGDRYEDFKYSNVCIPQASMATGDSTLINLAVTELTSPELMQYMLQQLALGHLPVDEAYEVEVDDRSGDVYDLTDGTVLRALESKYVGYLGYHEDAILYRSGTTWHFCVDDTSFKVDVLREGTATYNRRSMAGTKQEIEAMDACD